MKKIISFSLWGNEFRYIGGAIQNIQLAKLIYPDWICRFYIGKSTESKIIDEIKNNDNTEVILMDEVGDWSGMSWRFFSAYDKDIDIMISRDCDSRLTHREKLSVDEWVYSDKSFHIIRDNPNHNTPILGGMWGIKPKKINLPFDEIKNYKFGDFWQTDQIFLKEKIYPIVLKDSLIHEETIKLNYNSIVIPTGISRNPLHFIGQAYDGDGKILDRDEYFQDYLEKFNQNVILKIYEK